MFYIFSNPRHSHATYRPEFAPTLEGLAHKIIQNADQYDRFHLAGEEYYPEFYWSVDKSLRHHYPVVPEKRDVTAAMVDDIAAKLWDTTHAYIVGQEGTTTDREIAEYCVERYNLNLAGAHNSLDTYIGQVEAHDSKTIDRDSISDDDAEFLIGCIEEWWQDSFSHHQELRAVEEATDRYNDAKHVVEQQRSELYEAIRTAAEAGVPRDELAFTAGFSESQVFKILRETN